MKIPKRISAIFMAVIMLLSMGLNGLAASTPPDDPASLVNGSHTGGGSLTNRDFGRITIHKFDGVGDELRTHDGTKISDTTGFGTPLPGVEFKVYPVTLKGTAKEGSTAIADYNIDWDTYYWLITDDTLGNEGVAVLDNLPKNTIYYIEEVPYQSYTQVAPFFVSIPMTTANGANHIYDVHIYPKNEEMGFEKTPVVDNDKPGDNIRTWKISSTIPADIAKADVSKGYKYTITDALGTGLVLTDTDQTAGEAFVIDVFAVNAANTKVGASLAASDYTLTLSGPAGARTGFEISLKQSGFDKLKALAAVVGVDKAVKINVVFDSTIISDQALGELENEGGLEFINNDGAKFEKGTDPDEPPTAPSFGIKIVKTDIENASTLLGGADFYVYNKDTDAAAAVQDENYAAHNPLKKSNGSDWVVTTSNVAGPNKGIANFDGLTEGVYYLVESKAPAGYNKMTKYIKLEIIDTDGTYTYKIDGVDVPGGVVSFEATANVKNSDGFKLPLTGGAGTMLFTLIGLLLIGAAIVIYTISKKRKEKHA